MPIVHFFTHTFLFKRCAVRGLSKVPAAVFALALIAGTTFTGVKQSTAANNSGSKGTIALSLKTITNDDFQKALADAVKAKTESMGYTFLLVTAGEQTAVSTQVNQVEDVMATKARCLSFEARTAVWPGITAWTDSKRVSREVA